jgi:type I restriction enzyme, S subunit
MDLGFKPVPKSRAESRADQKSWVEKMPQGWLTMKLKYLIAQPVTDGPHTTPEFTLEGVPFLSVDGIQNGELFFEKTRFISQEDHDTFKTKAFPKKDDILMGKAASTGKIARVKVDFEFSIWSPLALIRPNINLIESGFLDYSLKSIYLQAQIENLCTSNTQKNISMDDIPTLQFLLPPLEVQKRIADYLDSETTQIDALILEKERMLDLLEEKRAALISQAVTKGLNPSASMKESGLEWLGKIPTHWELRRFKYLNYRIEQGFSPQCDNIPADTEQWGVLKTGCVNGGIFRENENKTLPNNVEPILEIEVQAQDILMSRASGSMHFIGAVALVKTQPKARLLLSDKIYRIKIIENLMNSEFFVYQMNSYIGRYQIRSFISGAEGLANNISQRDIQEMILIRPPLEEQMSIWKFIDQKLEMNLQIAKYLELSLELLRERRSALITAAVTGQLEFDKVSS